jgi:hypothetical protein
MNTFDLMNHLSKPVALGITAGLLAFGSGSSHGATFKWSGARNPCKASTGDGVTRLDAKIGRFITLSNNTEWAQVIFNVHNRFPGSTPWITMATGEMPEATLPDPRNRKSCSII